MSHKTADLWLSHLSSSLKAGSQTACLWNVESDSFEFMGDFAGTFGCEENLLPRTKLEFSTLINPQDLVTRQLSMADAIKRAREGVAGVAFTFSYKLRKADGTYKPVTETGTVNYDAGEKRTSVHSLICPDLAELQRQSEAFKSPAFKDRVSYAFSSSNGRQTLQYQLEEYLDNGVNRNMDHGFMMAVSIDRLSLINEAYGSVAADEVILNTGTRLEQIVGDRANVLRIGGDTFGVLFLNTHVAEMPDIANNILQVFYAQPIKTTERDVHAIVSIGGIKLNDITLRARSVISRAEIALREAKQRGRGCFVCYTEQLNAQVDNFRSNLDLGDAFLKGYNEGRVRVAFQAIMGSATNEVTFHECLIRLIGEDGTIHSAGKFIDAVEKMGLTRLVDGFCSKQAIAELKKYPDLRLSVNVSNHTLTDSRWLLDMSDELRDAPDVAERLIVEITESVAMSDINQTIRVLRTLEDLGCKIALDDFGAGQTAFTQLKDLHLDMVKIDKSFIREMDKQENMLFINTLHSLASGMNIETVGEGAETLAEADILMKGGINHIQGFAYGLPSIERIWLDPNHAERHTTGVSGGNDASSRVA
jgi:diguanylate cyclase (GGDEF)-like protein